MSTKPVGIIGILLTRPLGRNRRGWHMKLSTRSKYGLRALMDLAARDGSKPVRLKDLAEPNHIPVKFLEQILLLLRHAGILRSQVGARGGYSLAHPADEITL